MDDHTASSQSNISDDRQIVQSDGRSLTWTQCISNTNQELVKPIQALLSEPQVKKLHLNFEPEHANIEAYSIPKNLSQVRRVCQETDFLLNPDEKSASEQLKSELFFCTMLQLNGSFKANDGYTQYIPSFKEIMAWEQPVVEKTNIMYLELIPGKLDSVDMLVYALDKIHEFFVIKLSYYYVMVWGECKTVELLYKIKSDYGVKMEWLYIMLGSWHLIKDYLHVFLKKYQNAIVRSILSKMMTFDNIDSIIGCKVWWKSHNYTLWMLSVIIREFFEKFMQSFPPDYHQTIKSLTEQCEDCWLYKKWKVKSRMHWQFFDRT